MTRALQELTAGATPWPADRLSDAVKALEEIKKIRATESAHDVRRGPTSEADVASFQQWLLTHSGASPVQVQHVGDEGHGLVATQALKQGDAFISIPYGIVLGAHPSLGPAVDVKQWEQVERDPLVARFPSCMLALRVLSEACKPDTKKDSSFFKPYLSVLPSSFDIPLFYEPSDLEAIAGTPLYSSAAMLLFNSIKQFFYLQRLRSQSWSKCPIPVDKFTLSNYFWALGVVLTRQNEVVVDASGQATLALIPGWDMCNHEPGDEITTFCDPTKRLVTCHAQRAFQPQEQVTMFYGPRSNEQFLIYSGFVPSVNPYNRSSITIPLDTANDPLVKIRRMIISKEAAKDSALRAQDDAVTLQVSAEGSLVSYAMLRALQIACMGRDNLTKALRGSASIAADAIYEWSAEERALAKERYLLACEVEAKKLGEYASNAGETTRGKIFGRYFQAQLAAITAAKLNNDIFNA